MTSVLLLVHRLDQGGSERQMTEIAKGLNRNYFRPHVGCFHSEGLREEELRAAGIPILRLPVTSFASISALTGAMQMARYIWRHDIRIVHSFDVPLNIFSAPVARLALRPKMLASQRAHRELTPGLYHNLLRVTDHLVDGIVVNCEFMRRHLLEDEKVPGNLIHLCYNGIDTSVFRPASAVRPELLKDASLVVGVVCALRPEKGLSTLVAAFAAVAGGHYDAKLVIVGSGPCLSDLQQQVRAAGILDRVIFVPKTNDVATWLQAIDIFVLPSLTEALSNALMEAMACGCCAVASRVGGNQELIGESERGVLFQSQNSAELAMVLDGLLREKERRKRLAEAGERFIHERFSVAASVGRMQAIYASFSHRHEVG